MNLRAGYLDFVRQGRDQVGIELIFAALLRHIRPRTAEHLHERFHIITHLRRPFFHLLLQKPALKPAVPDQGVDHGKQQICLQLCCKNGRLIQVGAAGNAIIHVNIPPRGQQPHEGAARICPPQFSRM